MEQLTIDDVIFQFDENLANWEDVLGQFEKCSILAYVHEDALSPLEVGNGFRYDSEVFNYHTKIWGRYASAIQKYLLWVEKEPNETSWNKACRRLQDYRDSKKPCPMIVSRSKHFNNMNNFRPNHVVKYL